MARHFTLWGLLAKPTRAQIDEMLSDIRLLTYQEMRHLFPDCMIRRERFLGLTKSYVAVRLCNRFPADASTILADHTTKTDPLGCAVHPA